MFKEKLYHDIKVRVYTPEQKLHNATMRKLRNPEILSRDDYDVKRTLESIVHKIELKCMNNEKAILLKEIQNKRYREQQKLFYLQQSYIPKMKKEKKILTRVCGHSHTMNPNNKKRTWSQKTRLKTEKLSAQKEELLMKKRTH